MDKSKSVAIFFVNSLQNGGAERVVVNQATELLGRGYGIEMILIHDEMYYKIPSEFRIHVLYKKTNKLDKFIKQRAIAKKLDNTIGEIKKKKKIVLMTVHLPFAHRVCRYSKNKNDFLFVMHNPQFQYRFSGTKAFSISVKNIYDNKKIISVSQGVENELIHNIGVKTQYNKTIYNPININQIRKLQYEATSNDIENHPYILFVGRLTPQKKIDRLLEAFTIGNFGDKYNLVLLGVGELKDELQRKANMLGISDKVLFKGWEKNVYPWMRQAEMLVCSSDYESFGMVIVEALACGCKVVSTRCKFGPDEILVGKFSRYLSNLTAEDLANKMNNAIVNYPEITDDLIKKFDVRFIMDQYLETYSKWEGDLHG